MVEITPTLGRIVYYKLSKSDVAAIRHKRALLRITANEVHQGQVFPMMIVAVWGDTPLAAINGQVILDGYDTFWATSVHLGQNEGQYDWMDYQKGQAVKTEALEKKLRLERELAGLA